MTGLLVGGDFSIVKARLVLELEKEGEIPLRFEMEKIEIKDGVTLTDEEGHSHDGGFSFVVHEMFRDDIHGLHDLSRNDVIMPPAGHFIDLSLVGELVMVPDEDGLGYLYRTVEIDMYHELDNVRVLHEATVALYTCTCGEVGTATVPESDKDLVEKRARKNFRAHQKRAHAKAQKERDARQ